MGIVLDVAGARVRRPARLLACALHSKGYPIGRSRCGTTRGCMQKQREGLRESAKKSMGAPAGWCWLVAASTRPRFSRWCACSCCRKVGARQRFCCEAKGEGQWATAHARPALWAHHAGALAATLRSGKIVRRRTHHVQAAWRSGSGRTAAPRRWREGICNSLGVCAGLAAEQAGEGAGGLLDQ